MKITVGVKRVYEFTNLTVKRVISELRYELPTVEELEHMLRNSRISMMPVDEIADRGIITRDLDAFVSYVTLNKIRTVMYSFGFYTRAEIETRYELRDSDKRFFRGQRVEQKSSYASRYGYLRREPRPVEESDYSYYLAFSRYVMRHLDFRHPKELVLYTLFEGRLVSCVIADDWVGRLPLPDAEKLRADCINPDFFNANGPGSVQFLFANTEAADGSEWPSPEDFVRSIPPL